VITWTSETPSDPVRIGAGGWLRVALRGAAMGILVFGGLGVLLLVRLAERPLFGLHRPWTSRIVRFACRNALRIMGLPLRVRGTPLAGAGAEVANHATWLDIFVLNASSRVYFVSKAEVAGWAGIGWLARATGTVFIRRERRDAAEQAELFRGRLAAGHRLLFFPEGTSTDTLRVLPFKSTLFEAFFRPGLREAMVVQPVTVIYRAPRGESQRFYGWWGAMDFGESFAKILAAPRQGSVEVVYHPALRVADFADRKALAAACERAVRSAHPGGVEETQAGSG
jgi:1-acyl-sn-glycerol-3-phosphate acyltransferase